MSDIHASAIVHPEAEIGEGAVIGPFCQIGPQVQVGKNTRIEGPTVITRRARIGENVHIFPFVSLHHHSQDLKFHGEESWIEIGDGTTVREHASIHGGTAKDGLVTRIGRRNLIMTGVHIGHDVQTEDEVIIASNTALGGHVYVERQAILGGLVGVHQFVRIGRLAMVSAARIGGDIPPFALLHRDGFLGVNLVGLRRRGYTLPQIRRLQRAYEEIFPANDKDGQDNAYRERLLAVTQGVGNGDGDDEVLVRDFLRFLNEDNKRHLETLLFRPPDGAQ
ncbi:MAG: acyl-ACP--UDP-N-acetylglucosamine O-acyltransferase [Alphaproteobacteria bacterium]|nr:acyl-ACP--UDP-N-acetylglucosamine O-acyltransferase [Alphaproteobacteria bacterium]